MSEKQTFELRTLCSKDIFPMFKIISKIGIDEFKKCFETPEIIRMISEGAKGKEMQIGISVALEIASIIVTNLPKAEEDIYAFLSSVSGMKVKEIQNMEMGTFLEMIVALVRKEEFKDFFKVVSKLFNSGI